MIFTLYLPSCSWPSFILSKLKSIIYTLNDLVLSGESWLLVDGSASKDTTTKLDLEQIQESLLIDSLFSKDYHLSLFQFPPVKTLYFCWKKLRKPDLIAPKNKDAPA